MNTYAEQRTVLLDLEKQHLELSARLEELEKRVEGVLAECQKCRLRAYPATRMEPFRKRMGASSGISS